MGLPLDRFVNTLEGQQSYSALSHLYLPSLYPALFECFQTRNPHAVQPHLRKCFDAIAKLEFGVKLPESEMEVTEEGNLVEREMSFHTRDMLQAKLATTAKPEDLTTDIIAMLSPEGERVNLGKVTIHFRNHIMFKLILDIIHCT